MPYPVFFTYHNIIHTDKFQVKVLQIEALQFEVFDKSSTLVACTDVPHLKNLK